MRSLLLLNFVIHFKLIYGGEKIPIPCENCCNKRNKEFTIDPEKIKFELTAQNSSFVFDLNVNPKNLLTHGFDTKKETKILIHGFKTRPFEFCPQFLSVYDLDEFNFICVDWGDYSTTSFLYFFNHSIPRRTFVIGPIIGQKLVTILHELSYDPNLIHIIGWSAGAQLAGYIGKTAMKNGVQIGRITGLDPAGPGYKYHKRLLNRHDAKFVDVIHTNAGYLLPYFGYLEPLGHVDFYPNGGTHMPGCKPTPKCGLKRLT